MNPLKIKEIKFGEKDKILVANCFEDSLPLSKLILSYISLHGQRADFIPECTLNEVKFAISKNFYPFAIAVTKENIFYFGNCEGKSKRLVRWDEVPDNENNFWLREKYIQSLLDIFKNKIKESKIILMSYSNLLNLVNLLLKELRVRVVSLRSYKLNKYLLLKGIESYNCRYGFFLHPKGERIFIMDKKKGEWKKNGEDSIVTLLSYLMNNL
ncbi:hypothetical protein HRbin06_00697 [archaeon HR06]|nr:hypothetical protein HRbin06_00697 [archaeon HR06]